jgi:hypothetical protein
MMMKKRRWGRGSIMDGGDIFGNKKKYKSMSTFRLNVFKKK